MCSLRLDFNYQGVFGTGTAGGQERNRRRLLNSVNPQSQPLCAEAALKRQKQHEQTQSVCQQFPALSRPTGQTVMQGPSNWP